MPEDPRPRIVIIEDNPADAFLLIQELAPHALDDRVDVLQDGAQALAFVREMAREPVSPCVVVTDINLPMHDGLAVIKAIREEERLSDLRVIALTGVTSQKEELALRELGVCLYRSKPSNYDGFIALAQDIAAICRAGDSSAAAW